MISVVLLLCAQLVLHSHVHADDADHGPDDVVPVCVICLHIATGQDNAGLLPSDALATMPRLLAAAAVIGAADGVVRQAWRLGKPARGPPALAATALDDPLTTR